MTEQELEQVTLEYLMDIYKAEYVGKLKVEKVEPCGYIIKLGFNTPECPHVIYAELEDKKFLEFLRNQLKEMKLHLRSYGKLFKTMPPECTVVNRACSCNDK